MQQTLGYRSVSFTLTTYAHLFDDDLDELAMVRAMSPAVQTPYRPRFDL